MDKGLGGDQLGIMAIHTWLERNVTGSDQLEISWVLSLILLDTDQDEMVYPSLLACKNSIQERFTRLCSKLAVLTAPVSSDKITANI